MSFEKFEPKFDDYKLKLNKPEDWDVNPNELADGPANPTNKLEKEKNPEKESQEKEKQKKQQEVLNNLQKTESGIRQSEVASANKNLNQDIWPPVSFDDTDSILASQIGRTEGATSLDQTYT